MPVSEKIKEKIAALDESFEFKKLLLEVLEHEDKGSHRYGDDYEKLVGQYLSAQDGTEYDKNH